MDIEQLQATRAQLVYEFGEIEYERKLHVERVQYLERQSDAKIAELQQIEAQIDSFNNSIETFKNSEFYPEKNNENILKSE